MAITFQYNKTSLQRMEKQLKVRRNALPILKNKEAALRVEVKKAKKQAETMDRQLRASMDEHADIAHFWDRFDFDLLRVKDVTLDVRKIAGVKTPVLDTVDFDRRPFLLFNRPAWYADMRALLEEWTELVLKRKLLWRRMELLEQARKKTTQKVNLYEKVQIPDYEDAIRKIKRYLEDEENLAKAAQKIVKKRKEESTGL